ncbi:hypothetical protein RvY_18113 [Ramazzottius varieornatus]|uniref:BZIP domain-containing protein n=1 Tax=Ramazzottius varieornatus TaxID=947166 RepID=A0A1D1W4K9_RAMVA|nr:hypothetical protein RvY_18113 [Ramazzottius varieornatus]
MSLGSAGYSVWGRMGPSGQVMGHKSLLSSEQQTDLSLLEAIYGCGESSFGHFGFELCDSAFSLAEVTRDGSAGEGKALSDLQLIIDGLDMSMEQDLTFTPSSSAAEIHFTGNSGGANNGKLGEYGSFKSPLEVYGVDGYKNSSSRMELDDVLEGCLWDGTFAEPFHSGYNTTVPSVTPSLEEDGAFLASLEKLRQMLESTVPTLASISESCSYAPGTSTVGQHRATSVDSFDDSPFFSLSPSPAPSNLPTCPPTSAIESPVPTPPPRKSARQRKASSKARIAKSPSTSSLESTASKRAGKKVTPKKRGQNVKAARNYRQKKKDQEQDQTKEHQLVIAERDRLLQQHNSLQQELRFALKMAQARLDRLA